MSTWTLDQIKQVRGLRSVAQVDPEILNRGGGDAARHKMVLALTQMAHPFAVELHPSDFQFEKAADLNPRTFTIQIRCWWEPATKEVELSGGDVDGEVVTYRDAPDGTLVVPRPAGDSFSHDAEPWAEVTTNPVYRLSGWREDERRWVYSPV